MRDGQVEQQCADCATGGAGVVALVDEAPASRPSRRLGGVRLAAFASVVLSFVAAPASSHHRVAPLELGVQETIEIERELRTRIVAFDEPLVFHAFMASDPRPVSWHHPLAGDRRLPRSSSRRFKALRPRGEKRPECGGGHCGVDLGHLRGEVVHAAGDGIVDRIVRADDEIGGRYVRVRHSQGYTTFYMHLGRIHPALEVGQTVRAGDALGDIGVSGIKKSAPHLHFAIRETRADGSEVFVDPEPFLRKATVRASEAPFPRRHGS